jgi:hypothetical protein
VVKAGSLILTAILCALVAAAQASAAPVATVSCPAPYAIMVRTLTAMEAEVQIGVDYDRYENLLVKVRTAYNRLPTNSVSIACLNAVGIPAEQAMNNFIRASNSWAGCNRRVADGLSKSCVGSTSYGEASRRIYWQRASASIQKAVNSIG